MISLSRIEPSILFPRPAALSEGADSLSEFGRSWDQPDIRKNPRLWVKFYLEGLTLHARSLALAGRADRVLDLGCGGGWFSVALAQRRNDVFIDAIDTDGRMLDWGRYYVERQASLGKKIGRVRFCQTDVDEFPWAKYEDEFDLVHAGFILSRCKDPLQALDGIYKCLKPGGWLIYHDCTDPPARNLNRLARFQHAMVGWYNESSDPWSWRRAWERKYQFDTVRSRARTSEPKEEDVLRRLEELFAMRYHVRRRALLDMALNTGPQLTANRQLLYIPLVKLIDDICCHTNLLVGATRYVLGQKR